MIMHLVSPNYTLPTVLNTLKPPASIGSRTTTGARATTGTTGSGSTTTSDSGVDSIGSTFLSLLSTELQNQDPTAPVDSTAMVGQMISLNQLDQLININQTLAGDTTGTTASLKKPAATASDTASSSASGGLAKTLPAALAAAVMNALPFDPTTMMPLNPGNPGGTGASANSSFNPASINFSAANSTTSGGK
jgi:flagellar basal-body rod modification protein FlgD